MKELIYLCTFINLGMLVVNALLVHNCIKIYTEVVKYKIFKSKKEVV